MGFFKKFNWVLKCDACGAETPIGVHPAHMSPYSCRSCAKAVTFFYAFENDSPSDSGAATSTSPAPVGAQPTYWIFSSAFWVNSLSSLFVAVILMGACYFGSLSVIRQHIQEEVQRIRREELKGTETLPR